jgi:hypothetical protein
MFDLEQSIANWRRQMLAAGIQTPVPLEELEIHLREEIERQTKAGLNPQYVFISAVQKLGSAHTVQTEFMKVDKTHSALKWKLMEIGLTLATILVPLLFGGIVLKRASFIDMTAAEELSSLAALAAFSLLAWSGRLGHRFLPVIQNRRIRDAILFSCCVPLMLWWIVFLNFIVPRHDFTMGEFLVAFSWAFFTPAGAFIGLHWGIETAARKEIERPDVSASQG